MKNDDFPQQTVELPEGLPPKRIDIPE